MRSILRRYAIAAAIIAAAYAAGKAIELNGHTLVLNTSPSMPSGIYWIARGAQSAQRGDVVMFAPPDAVRATVYGRGWLPENTPLLKAIGGLAGDMYCIRGDRFVVEDHDVGPTFLLDAQGRPLPQLAGCRRVGDDEFLPVSNHIERSFDGRYMGSIPLRNVLGIGHALVTF